MQFYIHHDKLIKMLPIKTIYYKLDGVGPVDNRPSTDKLHRFVKNKM